MANPTIVNPTFRHDITGKLFKNKQSNVNPQETLVFNDLFTRLSIIKGDLPLFPNLGLKQHLFKFSFTDDSEIALAVEDFEEDVKNQTNRNCSIEYSLDRDNHSVHLSFELEGLEYKYEYEYVSVNNSIKIINYSFEE